MYTSFIFTAFNRFHRLSLFLLLIFLISATSFIYIYLQEKLKQNFRMFSFIYLFLLL